MRTWLSTLPVLVSRDETVKQGLAGRLSGYKKHAVLLLSSESLDVQKLHSSSSPTTSRSSPKTLRADKIRGRRDKQTELNIWWDEWEQDEIVMRLRDQINRCLSRYGSHEARRENIKDGIAQLAYLNDIILSPEIRNHLSKLSGVGIALAGEPVIGGRLSPSGDYGWSLRRATTASFYQKACSSRQIRR